MPKDGYGLARDEDWGKQTVCRAWTENSRRGVVGKNPAVALECSGREGIYI